MTKDQLIVEINNDPALLAIAAKAIINAKNVKSSDETIEEVINTVCHCICLTKEELFSDTRKHSVSHMRMIAWYFALNMTVIGPVMLSQKFKKYTSRDRTSMVHWGNMVEGWINVKHSSYYPIIKQVAQMLNADHLLKLS